MAGEPLADRDGRGPEVIELSTVPGFVVFDLPGAAASAGGTRLAPDVSVAEVVALPDFVCNAGAAIGYRSAGGATPEQVLAAVRATIGSLILEAMRHRDGPIAGACERAGAFLRGWWGEPPSPPYAPEPVG